MEPKNLRQWRRPETGELLHLFTCARPGRSLGKHALVDDRTVSNWASNLPGSPGATIVSLLGRKPSPSDKSEFSFYSFFGGWDKREERQSNPMFQEWLAQHHPDLRLKVVEHPTIDSRIIPDVCLASILQDVRDILDAGRTVILVDSGGVQRTGQVCRTLGFEIAGK